MLWPGRAPSFQNHLHAARREKGREDVFEARKRPPLKEITKFLHLYI